MDHPPLCAEPGTDPGLWFSGPEDARAAKAICARCPAADECLAQALAWHPVAGIWGGTTIGQRRRLLADRDHGHQRQGLRTPAGALR